MDQHKGSESAAATSDRIWMAYEAHAAELRRYATGRLRDADAAEDIVQESFLRLALESQMRAYPRQARAWLYRVARNLIISDGRRATVARRQAAQDRFDDVTGESPESAFLASERCRTLGTAMGAVGSAGRTGLILAAQGFSGREIAEVLGRSDGATRTLLCRARSRVRYELDGQEAALFAG